MTIANGSPTIDIPSLDPYQFMTVIGKRVIHPGSRRSSEEVFVLAAPASTHVVLDVGCGVGTSAIAIAHRFGAHAGLVNYPKEKMSSLQSQLSSSTDIEVVS
ncbi:MAG: hypothetical protein NVS2B16_24680 [Chloroflexota bacterium]